MPEKLTRAMAARIAEVSAETISRLSNTGQLPFEQTPLGRLYQRSDIERLRDERLAAGKTPR